MLDIGFSEILVIVGLALVVLGPTKLPQVARTIGRWAGRARAMARQFQEQLENETGELKVNLDSVKTTMNEVRDAAAAAVSPTSAAQGAPPAQSPPPAEPALPAEPATPAQPVDEFAARDARTTPEAMHAADPPPPKDSSP
jgi:sec-independent protein translocase protein TatB